MRADGRFLVTQGVEVCDVVRWRSELSAVLTGGDEPDCRRHVRWRFADEADVISRRGPLEAAIGAPVRANGRASAPMIS